MSSDRREINFYSMTGGMGGSEVYLKNLLLSFDYKNYKAALICSPDDPFFLQDTQLNPLIERGDITIKFFGTASARGSEAGATAHAVEPVIRKESLKQKVWRRIVPSSIKLLMGTWRDTRKLVRYFKQNPVNILHVNDAGAEPASIAARLAGVPHIIGTLHVLPYNSMQDWVSCLIEFFSIRSMHVAIAVSEAAKKAWMQQTRVAGEHIKVVLNGMDLSAFTGEYDVAAVRQELRIPPAAYVISVPARLHPLKGHQYLFEAVSQIRSELPQIIVLITGDGVSRESLQKMVEGLGIGSMVRFLGHRADIARIMAASDLVVLPSLSETLGLVLAEAQAAGKAVIATNIGGIPEVVENGVTGMLIPPSDSPALARAIIQLVQNPAQCQEMGKKGRERVNNVFSTQRMVVQTLEIYHGLPDR